jgi:hypothetical protein
VHLLKHIGDSVQVSHSELDLLWPEAC